MKYQMHLKPEIKTFVLSGANLHFNTFVLSVEGVEDVEAVKVVETAVHAFH